MIVVVSRNIPIKRKRRKEISSDNMKLEEYKRFLGLLAPHRAYDWIERPLNSDTWKSRRHGALEVGVLTKGHPVGIRPHKTKCCWAAIDIDFKRSQYHPARDTGAIDNIRGFLRDQGLQAVILVQSSASKGIHIWIPLPQLGTQAFAFWFYQLFTSNGYEVKPGILELFPNVARGQSLLNGLRLPLIANDSWILDDNLDHCHQNINSFCDAWENGLEVNADFKPYPYETKLNVSAPIYKGLLGAKQRLRDGFSGRGQTNTLAAAAAYIASTEGLSGSALQRRSNSLLKEAPGCKEWSRHWSEIAKGTYQGWTKHYSKNGGRIRAKSLEKAAQKKKTDPNYNQKFSAERREKLANTVTYFKKQGSSFPHRSAAKRAINDYLKDSEGKGMSNSTLIKHLDLVDQLVAKPD